MIAIEQGLPCVEIPLAGGNSKPETILVAGNTKSVRFSKATLKQAKIRDRSLSLGVNQGKQELGGNPNFMPHDDPYREPHIVLCELMARRRVWTLSFFGPYIGKIQIQKRSNLQYRRWTFFGNSEKYSALFRSSVCHIVHMSKLCRRQWSF